MSPEAATATGGSRPLAGALEAHPFLRGMGREHINTLAEYATATGFAAGELIFKEGDLANRFYLILEGCVALEAALPGDGAREVERIGPGETLGWSWMFPPFRWHFAARARVPTKAIFIYGTWLLECCEADPALGYELTKRIALVAIGRLQSARSLLAAATSAGRER